MNKKKENSNEISKLRTKLLSRGVRLFSAGVKSSLKGAEFAINTAFMNQEEKKEAYKQFLIDQFKIFADEMERLKGGIMKAGQMLSMFGEHLFPDEINQILKKLQSNSKPVTYSVMEKAIKKSLGKERFEKLTITKSPIGAASLGQVYRVEIAGNLYALKAQYPGVAKSIDSDLKAIRSILKIINLIPHDFNTDDIYAEIRDMLHKEADYSKELKSLEVYQKLTSELSGFKVPIPYPEFSTKKILCMSYEKGVRIDDPKVSSLSIERKNKLAHKFLELLFNEVFIWKRVQTDPHLGNFLIRIKEDFESEGATEDEIVLLDFGAVRKLPNSYVKNIRDLALASLLNNEDSIIKSAYNLGFLKPGDPSTSKDLFVRLVLKGTEPFHEKHQSSVAGSPSNAFDWGSGSLMKELAEMAKDAVFSFKLRPPPKEAIFVDRKLLGTSSILSSLGAIYGPRELALKYLEKSKELY